MDKLGEKQTISRKLAASQQIEMAIKLFSSRDFACSITLALAAEDQLPEVDDPYLFKQLKEIAPVDVFNFTRNWLKHHVPPDEIDLFEFGVIVALMRAISKYFAAYRELSPTMRRFDHWMKRTGLRTDTPLGYIDPES